MAEILVKTATRNRDKKSKFYFDDWTAFDVVEIRPDGFYSSNPHGGAKRWGIVLKVDGDLPSHFHLWNEHKKEESRQKGRSKFIIDFTKHLDKTKCDDLFNPALLVDPIQINKAYIDLFEERSKRKDLDERDVGATFTSGTVDVGPNGHADANTFFEFESNCGNLTGDLTGDSDEGSWNDTVQYKPYGFTISPYTFTTKCSGAARVASAKWDATKHYFTQSATAQTMVPRIAGDMVFDGLQVEMPNIVTNNQCVYIHPDSEGADIVFKNCIFKTGDCGIDVSAGDAQDHLMIANCVVYCTQTRPAGSEGIHFHANNGRVYNTVVAYFDDGIELDAGGVMTVKNCAVLQNADDIDNAGSATIDYNAIEDGDGSNVVQPSDWTTVFEDYPNRDFRLKTTDTDLHDAGIGPASDSNVLTTALNGGARSGTDCDIGAEEDTPASESSYSSSSSQSVTKSSSSVTSSSVSGSKSSSSKAVTEVEDVVASASSAAGSQSSSSYSQSITKTSSSVSVSGSQSVTKTSSSSSSSQSVTKTSSSISETKSSSWSSPSLTKTSSSISSSSSILSKSSSSSSSIESKSSSLSSASISQTSSSSYSVTKTSSSISQSQSSSSISGSISSTSVSDSIAIGENGVTFGELNAAPETALSFEGWKYRESAVEADYTDIWGRLKLQTDDEFVSPVIDLGNTDSKYLSIKLNVYEAGYGSIDVEWRGQATAFNQSDDQVSGPVWESYVEGNKTWRYIQLKVSSA